MNPNASNPSRHLLARYRRPLRYAVALLALAYWSITAAHADLTWPNKTIELHADAEASVLEARYRFTNDGTTPVDIRQVQTSCGCTTVALAQRHFEPGQTGEIVARYAVGEHVGLQKKSILVTTSDHPLIPTALTLVVHLPEYVRLEPAAVSWTQGEAPAPKAILVNPAPGAAAPQAVSVLSSNRLLPATLQPGVEPGRYVVTVTPASTDKAQFASLSILCKLAGGGEKTFHAFASVQAPMPSRWAPAATPRAAAMATPSPTPEVNPTSTPAESGVEQPHSK